MNKIPKDITTEELMKIDYRYSYSEEELFADWKKLFETKEFKTGAQFKPGMKLCQHFHPNFWTIQNDKGLSFADCWSNYELMDQVREWGLKGMSELWLSWVRRAVYMSSGLPNSSFYRPHFSKQIIKQFSKKPEGLLFDPCAGWGGRMLGTVSAGWQYVSCEPNVETYNNLQKMVDFLRINDKVRLYNIPVETFDFSSISAVDVLLTSPPYFNLEVYNKDENQSYNTFNTYETWRDNWLFPLIDKSLSLLSEDGLSCWNVMSFKKYDLVNDVISFHNEKGFSVIDTVGFKSPIANIRNLKNKDVTYIFKRQ